MHVSHASQIRNLAPLPKLSKIATIKMNDSGIQAVGIEIVVEHIVTDPSSPEPTAAQQKSTAFSFSISASIAQVGH